MLIQRPRPHGGAAFWDSDYRANELRPGLRVRFPNWPVDTDGQTKTKVGVIVSTDSRGVCRIRLEDSGYELPNCKKGSFQIWRTGG